MFYPMPSIHPHFGESHLMGVPLALRRALPPLLLAAALVGLAFVPRGIAADDEPKPITAQEVKDLQAKYKEERTAADKDGLTKKYSPDWFARADALAVKSEKALAAGR